MEITGNNGDIDSIVPDREVKTLENRLVLPSRIIDMPTSPLRTADITNFQARFCIDGQSQALYDKIFGNLRFIDQEHFSDATSSIAGAIDSFVGSALYVVYSMYPGKSGRLHI